MLPFEFTIKGPPVSAQTRNRRRLQSWKQQVRAAAQAHIAAGVAPIDDEVTLTITYFYESDTPDVDNIIKPIQDALVGLVFVDDSQIVDTRSRKKSLDGSYRIRGASSVLLHGFANGDEFLHVQLNKPAGGEDLSE